jgi:pimeloyl-ACP methyl ester carboxylesterase
MSKAVRILLIALAILLLAVVIGPFLVPVPALEDTVPPEQLADAGSCFVEVDGLQVHYKIGGAQPGVCAVPASPERPTLLLLHGFAASTFSWREVMDPLAEQATVVAFDRPAFGLTERPMPAEWQGQSPYSPEAQADLTVGLMDELGIGQAILVGNSAGGTTAMLVALRHPERVEALVLVDAAIYSGGSPFPGWVRPLLTSPQMRRLGPLFARAIQQWGEEFGRSAWHDPSQFTADIWEGYTRPLQAQNRDRALWELTIASHPLNLPDRFDELDLPILVVTGDDDRIVPTEQSIRLADELPGAELVVFPECGHVPQEECPAAFLEAVQAFMIDL